jgi:hypothetical protein
LYTSQLIGATDTVWSANLGSAVATGGGMLLLDDVGEFSVAAAGGAAVRIHPLRYTQLGCPQVT